MNRSGLVRLVALSGVWGSSFLFIKVALDGLAPAQVVLGRLVFGAIVLVLAVTIRHEQWPRRRSVWGHLAVLAVVANVLPFCLFAWGEQRVSSALAGLLNAATPLMTMCIGWLLVPEERANRVRALGVIGGFVGVAIILAPWRRGAGGNLAGELACLGAAACYGLAFSYTKRFVSGRAEAPTPLAAGQITVAAAMSLVVTPVLAPHGPHLTPAIAGAVLALGAGGTGLAYLLYYRLIAELGATTTSMVTYLMPVTAVVLGVLVRHEPITLDMALGAAIVVGAVALAEGRWAARRTVAAVSSP